MPSIHFTDSIVQQHGLEIPGCNIADLGNLAENNILAPEIELFSANNEAGYDDAYEYSEYSPQPGA
jgi:hypothetical protein